MQFSLSVLGVSLAASFYTLCTCTNGYKLALHMYVPVNHLRADMLSFMQGRN